MKIWLVWFMAAGLCVAALIVCWRRLCQGRSGEHSLPVLDNVREDMADTPPPSPGKPREDSRVAGLRNQPVPDPWAAQRAAMVQRQLAARDITDRHVLEVLGRVPRHEFVPPNLVNQAYIDSPLPIGHGQTISQPYIVALMTQLAGPRRDAVALDVGTGSGYQAAVLAEWCHHVYSVEIIPDLATSAAQRLERLGYTNVTVRCGDGYRGWSKRAPFDLIIVAAAPEHVPQPLLEQLREGGRLVIPVGGYNQTLWVFEKQPDGAIRRREVVPVAFVPMTGEAREGHHFQGTPITPPP